MKERRYDCLMFRVLVEKLDTPLGDENGSLSSVVKVLCTVEKNFPGRGQKSIM